MFYPLQLVNPHSGKVRFSFAGKELCRFNAAIVKFAQSDTSPRKFQVQAQVRCKCDANDTEAGIATRAGIDENSFA
jgi:hypothetical protein